MQHALYRTAEADPGRRFYALRDKVCRRDVLERAWVNVRRNGGAAGIDRATIAVVEQHGGSRLLDELATDLQDGSWRPLAARRVFIPKPGSGELRPLSIPTVRDRIVQAAEKIVLEPIFEADGADCSFGFRPRRAAHDALQVLVDDSWRGRRWVVETDIANCFEAIPHEKLMQAVEERVCDQSVLKLLRVMLRAGVLSDGQVYRPVTGTPRAGRRWTAAGAGAVWGTSDVSKVGVSVGQDLQRDNHDGEDGSAEGEKPLADATAPLLAHGSVLASCARSCSTVRTSPLQR